MLRPAKSSTFVKVAFAALLAIAALGNLATSPALAEGTISVYGGANFSPHSVVKTNAPGAIRNSVGWDGASFEMPPYWGLRATWWLEDNPEWGIGLDFTHGKVKADPVPLGYTKLEFTDGINFLIANAYYRHDMGNGFTPYGGLGLGLSIPHVEVAGPAFGPFVTNGYQVTGMAAQALVGLDYEFHPDWSVFGELKSTYGQVDADLSGGFKLKTDVISNQVILGLTYKLF